MRVLVYPHELLIGGAPINAIDLAAEVADRGHDVLVYGRPGPLTRYLRAKGLPYIQAHSLKYRPGPPRIRELIELTRRNQIDLVHGYEWPPCLDAYFGPALVDGVALVCSVMSMTVSPLIPPSVPLLVGTSALRDAAAATRPAPVAVLEPPVNTILDNPSVDGSAFRREWRIARDQMLVVVVSRLGIATKLDALERAVDGIGILADGLPVQLMLVGDGEAREALQQRAEIVNGRVGRQVVTMAGPLLDPRPAYAAADIVLGMGSSALRGMAFGKPTVIQGENGFSTVFDEASWPVFARQGFFGVGRGEDAQVLAAQLRGLVESEARRAELGRYAASIVQRHFALAGTANRLLTFYEQVLDAGATRVQRLPEAVATACRAMCAEALRHVPSRNRSLRQLESARLLAAALDGQAGPPSPSDLQPAPRSWPGLLSAIGRQRRPRRPGEPYHRQ